MGKRYSAYWRSWKNCSVEPVLWQSPAKIELGGALGKSGKRTADQPEEMKSFGSKRSRSFGKRKISRKKTNSRRSRALATSASATGIFSVACSNVSLRRASRRRLVGGEGFAVDASLIQADR